MMAIFVTIQIYDIIKVVGVNLVKREVTITKIGTTLNPFINLVENQMCLQSVTKHFDQLSSINGGLPHWTQQGYSVPQINIYCRTSSLCIAVWHFLQGLPNWPMVALPPGPQGCLTQERRLVLY